MHALFSLRGGWNSSGIQMEEGGGHQNSLAAEFLASQLGADKLASQLGADKLARQLSSDGDALIIMLGTNAIFMVPRDASPNSGPVATSPDSPASTAPLMSTCAHDDHSGNGVGDASYSIQDAS
jgi:hypothetical protein